MLQLSYNYLVTYMTKQQFLQSDEPLTLFCHVDLEGEQVAYEVVHPNQERETQQRIVAEYPERIYLYIRNQAARDLIGNYGRTVQGSIAMA